MKFPKYLLVILILALAGCVTLDKIVGYAEQNQGCKTQNECEVTGELCGGVWLCQNSECICNQTQKSELGTCTTPADCEGLIHIMCLGSWSCVNGKCMYTCEQQQEPAIRPQAPETTFVQYNGGFFTLDIPQGWTVKTAGQCGNFAFLASDPDNPIRKVWYFGEFGPFYLSEQQRVIDQQYMGMGGYPVQWIDMPVINPLTAENFLQHYSMMWDTQLGRRSSLKDPPLFENIEVVSSSQETSPIQSADAKTIRALFRENGKVGEGLFDVVVGTLLPEMGGPASGVGIAWIFAGISTESREFPQTQPTLLKVMQSFAFNPGYVQSCIQSSNEATAGILKAGKTLSETSDIIMSAWENRNTVDDILSEKRSDAMLGVDRVYSPDTGSVYEVSSGWYDDYNSNRQNFQMSNLQKLPDNSWDLWTAPTKSASEIQ